MKHIFYHMTLTVFVLFFATISFADDAKTGVDKTPSSTSGKGTHGADSSAAVSPQKVRTNIGGLEFESTPSTEFDPAMRRVPHQQIELAKAQLALLSKQIDEVESDTKLTKEEKQVLIKNLEATKRMVITLAQPVLNHYDNVAGMFVCGGVELPLQYLAKILPGKLKNSKPSIGWAPLCIICTVPVNSATSGVTFPSCGVGTLATGELQKGSEDNGGGFEVEFPIVGLLLKGTVERFVPEVIDVWDIRKNWYMAQRAPLLRLGDYQGSYFGVGAEFTGTTEKTTAINRGTYSVSYLMRPNLQSSMILIEKGVNHQPPGHVPKAQWAHLVTYWGTDESEVMKPNISWTGWQRQARASKHYYQNRLTEIIPQESVELIKELEAQAFKSKSK